MEFHHQLQDAHFPMPEIWRFTPVVQKSGNTPTKDLEYIPIVSCPGIGGEQVTLGPGIAVICPLPRAQVLAEIHSPEDPVDDVPIIESMTPLYHPGRALLGPHGETPIGWVGFSPTS
jgi:hypothetical protein